jgi:hypothetical protein
MIVELNANLSDTPYNQRKERRRELIVVIVVYMDYPLCLNYFLISK